VAVSIHRASDGSRTGRVAAGAVPYTDRAVAFAAAAVVLLALGIYLRTMLPSTGFWDTGEAQTVPPTLSIFHPTGFPTYEILGWLWTRLPIGEVAWRMNLLSAVCMAAAAALLARTVARPAPAAPCAIRREMSRARSQPPATLTSLTRFVRELSAGSPVVGPRRSRDG